MILWMAHHHMLTMSASAEFVVGVRQCFSGPHLGCLWKGAAMLALGHMRAPSL